MQISDAMKQDFSLGRVEVAMSPMERFEEFLSSRGKRITQQRRTIVEQVFSHHEHFDADELIDMLSKQAGDKVSRPTVYRTLTELVDAGLLNKMELSGRAVYEHDYGYPEHDHLYCTECGDLIEFQTDELIKIRDEVAKANHFRVTGHKLIISGVCDKCMKAKRRPKRKVDLI